MKAVVQRCTGACVVVEGKVVGQIGCGLTVFLGVMADDGEAQLTQLVQKILSLRIFDDESGRFNYSVRDVNGSILLVPNFTVCGDARKGSRPSFGAAAAPAMAEALYERFATLLRSALGSIETGIFSADMKVLVENDGPVTVILEVE